MSGLVLFPKKEKRSMDCYKEKQITRSDLKSISKALNFKPLLTLKRTSKGITCVEIKPRAHLLYVMNFDFYIR